MSIHALFESLQEAALPGIWSKGVALAREKCVILERENPDEIHLVVQTGGKAVSPRVTLWPEEDDSHCDCGSKIEPCIHIVASIVSLKNGWIRSKETAGAAPLARLEYRFSSAAGALRFERVIVDASGDEQPLTTSLVSLIGGIGAGRIPGPPIPATREDYKADQIISELEKEDHLNRGTLDRRAIPRLFGALQGFANCTYAGDPVEVQARSAKPQALLEDSPEGVRLELRKTSQEGSISFSNGAALEGRLLRPEPALSTVIREATGREFRPADFPLLVSRLLPLLEKETELETRSRKLPKLERIKPRFILETHRDPARPEELEVMPRLFYGDPPWAEVIQNQLEYFPGASVPERDEPEEQRLIRELQSELHLAPRQRIRLRGDEAIRFLRDSVKWNQQGKAVQEFSVKGDLVPRVHGGLHGLKIEFHLPVGANPKQGSAETSQVLNAWRKGEKTVPLLDGGWATIPTEWLSRNIERLESLLALRHMTTLNQIAIAEFVMDTEGELSADLSILREKLMDFKGLTERKPPSDLRAELRPYQKVGVNWLSEMRDLGLGALLADDMGLGKTLQALTVIRDRTLVVAPTSVLPSWEEQIRSFRPALRLNLYYGSGRRFESGAEVTLTSYGILRQDRALLAQEPWDLVILDEAQQIKNPDSQLAQIAHSLRGKFRIALTGTPIENRLDDLWSQFQFIQPGLLGTRSDFQMRYHLGQVEEIRRRIRPLILRRMKGEVAPELPEKTETLLYCDLKESEQSAYRTILAATQEKVIQELQAGGSIMGALEALLRLRQICAHPALVPGLEEETFSPSSKMELLQETLEESLALGHSVLIFSQWTSFLDLVEKQLDSLGIERARLDGTTRDRAAVIQSFQDPKGPRVMLLSLKAGGVGLTLTKADHVIILDPWWNPAVEDQAADRAHRIGQTQPVLVQRLVARDTVEEKILLLQKKKKELARQVLENGGQGGSAEFSLTREDLLGLLR